MGCSRARQLAASFALLAGALVLCASLGNVAVEASIEKEPVKVTHRNSGPRYDIDEVERTRLNADASENFVVPTTSAPQLRNDHISPGDQMGSLPPPLRVPGEPEIEATREGPQEDSSREPIGHVTIRRIFLFPMAASPSSDSRDEQGAEQREAPARRHFLFMRRPEQEQPQLPPGSEHPSFDHRPAHMFGADEASRPTRPSNDEFSPVSFAGRMIPLAMGGERDMLGSHSNEQPAGQIIEPLRMMLEMMHQALNSGPSGERSDGPNIFSDLSREASANRPQQGATDQKDSEQANSDSGASEKPKSELESTAQSPQSMRVKNETREDIVEIDGKKFLRKSVTSKHVGDNVMFMTKRLIFTPLNETATTAPVSVAVSESAAAPEPTVLPTQSGPFVAETLPEVTTGEPESVKIEGGPMDFKIDSDVLSNPSSKDVSAAPPAVGLATEMPSIPTTEPKPNNPETLAPAKNSTPALASEPASGQAQPESPASQSSPASSPSADERPSIPTVVTPPALSSAGNADTTSTRVTKDELEKPKVEEGTASAATGNSQ